MCGLAQLDAVFPVCLSWLEIVTLGRDSQRHYWAIVARPPVAIRPVPHAKGHRSHVICLQGRPAAPADRRWLVLIVVAVAQLMVVLDSTVVNIALPSAQRSLGFPTVTGSGW